MLQDYRFVVRSLVNRPGYTAGIVATLAIGIGATTLMFSLIDATLVRALPFRDSDRLVFLTGVAGPQRAPRGGSVPEIRDWRTMNQTLQDVAIYDEYSLNLQSGDEVSRVEAEMVSAAYFPLLGVQAAIGRTFTAEDDAVPDRQAVAVISDALWRRMFGADPAILQRTIELNDRAFSIVGVMPPRFAGISFDTEVWVPSMMVTLTSGPAAVDNRGSRWLGAIARLKDGVAIETAQRDLDRVAAILEQQHPAFNRERGVQVDELRSTLVGETGGLLLSLFGGVVVFLVVACVNVASLQLARAVARRRELALRLALGATRRHLLQELFAESFVLAVVAAIVGTLCAAWALTAVVSWLPQGVLPRYITPSIDPRAVVFALAVASLAAALVSIVPGLAASRGDLSGAMKQGERAAGPGLASLRHPSAQQGLVVAEIALAMTLLTAAGLMVRSLERRAAVPLGFDADGVTVARLVLPAARYDTAGRTVLVDRLVAGIRELPLVRNVAVATSLPFTGNISAANFVADNASTDAPRQRYYRHFVTPDYFQTLSLVLRAGRVFTPQDDADAPQVAIINESAARRIWGQTDAVGRRIRLGDIKGPLVEIVGVVGDARFRDLTTDLSARVEPDVFFPYAQRGTPEIEVAVRTADGSPLQIGALQQAVNAVGGGLPLFRVRPLSEAVSQQTANARFGSALFTIFSTGALVLAAVGLYGLISYVVGVSRREIAIRLALGANSRRLVALIVRNGMALVGAGLLLGAAGAAAAGHALKAQLFPAQAVDPVMLALVSALLLAVAFVAALVPGMRAAAIEPHRALRSLS